MTPERVGLILVLCLLMWLSVWRFRTLINPVMAASFSWVVVFIGQEFFSDEFPITSLSALIIAGFLGNFALGALLASLRNDSGGPFPALNLRFAPKRSAVFLWQALLWNMVGIAAMHLALTVYYVYVLGIGAYADGALDSYELVNQLENSSLGWFQRGSQSLIYAAAALLGIDAARRQRFTAPAILFLLLVIARGVVLTNRTPVYLSLMILGLAYAVVHARKYTHISSRICLLVIAAVLAFGAFSWVATERRYGSGNSTNEQMGETTRVSLLGAPSGLALYLDRSDEWKYGDLRGISLNGPLALVGLVERAPSGVYTGDDVQYLTPNALSLTNQYSGLRLIMEDIGVVGALMFFLILGYVTTALFYAFYRHPNGWQFSLLVNIYLLLLWMPIAMLSHYVFWLADLLVVGALTAGLLEVVPLALSRPARGSRASLSHLTRSKEPV